MLHAFWVALTTCTWLVYVRILGCAYDKLTASLELVDKYHYEITSDLPNYLGGALALCPNVEKLTIGIEHKESLFIDKIPVFAEAYKDSLKELTLHSKCLASEDVDILSIAAQATHLERLELFEVCVTPEGLKRLGESCQALQCLSIIGNPWFSLRMSDEGLESLFSSGCKRLKELTLSHISSLTANSLTAIVTHRIPLQKLAWRNVGVSLTNVLLNKLRQDFKDLGILPVLSCGMGPPTRAARRSKRILREREFRDVDDGLDDDF